MGHPVVPGGPGPGCMGSEKLKGSLPQGIARPTSPAVLRWVAVLAGGPGWGEVVLEEVTSPEEQILL